MQILVLGADGFLGSHIVDAAKARGHEVTEIVMYRPEGTVGYASSSAVRGDIADPIFMRPYVEEADVVINCAAYVSVPYGQVMPGSYKRTNADAVFTMLQLRPQRFIQISTSEVFDGKTPPCYPDDPLNPVTWYGASKACAEQWCRARADQGVTICRVFNMFGPRQYPRAVHPIFIREALRVANSEKEVAELDGPHGSRAFLYAPWVAGQILDKVIDDDRPLIQLASSEPIEISALWPMVANAAGIDPSLVRWNPDGGKREVARLYGYSSEGYDTPEYPLDGLAETVEWYRQLEESSLPAAFAATSYQ